jgi:diaminopimelate epimerase
VTSILVKVEASGNDFLLGVGDWASRLRDDAALARSLCDRRRGIGADGVIAVESISSDRVRIVHRNADGSRSVFCGNGTRCAARVAVELLDSPQHLLVETEWAEIPAVVNGAEVSLELGAPSAPPSRLAIQIAGSPVQAWSLTVGVPHLVVAVDEPGTLELEELAPPLRRHPAFGPEGCNVDFVAADASEPLAVRTWERGVEAETLSCGSGIVASALVVMARRNLRRIRLAPRSGDELMVEALGRPPECPVRFTGATRILAEILPFDQLLRI